MAETSARHSVIEHGDNVLEIPKLKYWGSPEVYFNGNRIPSARIWEICAVFLSHGKKVPDHLLIEEARRADIFRLIDSGQLIYTTTPREGDIEKGKNIYVRKEKQRVRALVKHFGIKIAKIEGELEAVAIRGLCAFCADIGLYPVAYQENKIYFCTDPDAIYKAVGGFDPIRLIVYCKRPSASSFKVKLNGNFC